MKKLKPTYLLKEPKSKEPTLIYFFMTLDKGKIKRSIQRKVLPTNWDYEEKRPKRDKELRKYLESIDQAVDDAINDCRRNKRVVGCADIQAVLDVELQNTGTRKAPIEGAVPERDMFTDFQAIIAGMKDGTVLTPGKKKKRYQVSTIRQYESVRVILEEFFTEKKVPRNHEKVTMETYNDFISWCHGKDHSNNYIGTLIKRWKRFAGVSREKGWHGNNVFESDQFVKITEETNDIALDEEKIQRLYRAKVGIDIADLARDWFVLDCYLGLRVSDLLTLDEKDFAGEVFELINKKTGAHVAVPINPTVRAIIKKYEGLPSAISDTHLNRWIKEVGRKAGLTAIFIYTITKGGRLVTIRSKEWEMLSSHTCRRSFITNLLRMGVAPHLVMLLAGISDYDTLKRYFKLTPREAAKDVAGHEYFTGRKTKHDNKK